MTKRLGGIIGCKDKTYSSWHLIGFPIVIGENPTIILYTYIINRRAGTPDLRHDEPVSQFVIVGLT